MKQFLAWCARVILLPLLPAIVGSAIRSVYSGEWGWQSLDAAELAFSLAIIGVIVLSSVSRLADIPLRDTLSPVFIILLALALCLFAGSILITLIHQAEQSEIIASLKTTGVPSPILQQLGSPDRCTKISAQIRSATLILGAVTMIFAVAARIRYTIEE